MSTRECAQMIFDCLTDEQLEGFVMLFTGKFSSDIPEPPNTVHSKAELEQMLAEAEDDVRNGRVMSLEEVKSQFREEYGI